MPVRMRTLAAVSACGLLVLVPPITLTAQSSPPAQSASEIQVVRAAAESGDAVAQHKLGMAYATGEGVSQNDAQAAAWFRKAAEQGFADAQYNLGVAYFAGQGVPQDAVHDAIEDFTRAIQLSSTDQTLVFVRARALYCRGVAKRRNGDASGGDVDILSARNLRATVEDEMADVCPSR